MTTPSPDRPRRRWWRPSLRALMVLVLACGGGLGYQLDRARRQREAVEALRALGVAVVYDDEQVVPVGPVRLAALRRWLGAGSFRAVDEVALRGRADDRKLGLLAHLGGFRKLSLNYRAGDGDLAALAGLGGLESLDIRGPGLDDRTVAPLGRLTSLKELRIQTTRLTDAGLAPLRSLRRLETLHVEFSPDVRSPGVVELVGALPCLADLSLWWTSVDATAVPTIARVPHLKRVILPRVEDGAGAALDARPGLAVWWRDGYVPPTAAAPRNPATPPGGGAAVATRGGGVDRSGVAKGGRAVGDSGGKGSAVLDRLREKHRPVLVFGPGPEDERVVRQRHSWVGALPEAGIKDRDLVVVEAFEAGEGTVGGAPLPAAEAQELRAALGIAPGRFAVVLVGRDGGAKDRWDAPVAPHEIFGKVDAMPMRQREVEEKGGGSK